MTKKISDGDILTAKQCNKKTNLTSEMPDVHKTNLLAWKPLKCFNHANFVMSAFHVVQQSKS